MKLQFGISSYERARGDLPELPVVNFYAEEAPTEARQVVLQSRPGLVDLAADMGGGPVKALFRRDGVLGNALFGVSAGNLYRGTTAIGAVSGAGHWSLAGYENLLFAAGGSGLYGYDGSALNQIATPDDFAVSKVLVAASRVVVLRADDGRFYWTDVLESDVEALDFATAESQPDRLRDALFVDDTLLLFGAETVEWLANTRGDPPYAPIEGRVVERGIRATGCATAIGSSFAWVTNLNEVCLGDENRVISTPGLQARIAASADVSLFSFVLDGMDFLALRLDDETQVWSRRSGLWSEFASYGLDNWVAGSFADGVFGSAYDGRTFRWNAGHEDLGGVLERRFRAGEAIDGGGFRVNNMRLRCNTGQSPFTSGDYAAPQVEMRLSDDGGLNWGAWEAETLGRQGDYRVQPEWRALGMASQPGFLAEFRVTAPIDFRVSDVMVNEPGGGR